MKKLSLKRKYLIIARMLLLSLFIVSSIHFIFTWIYMIINPFIQEYLVSFTWLGLSMNVFELFYVIWFIEYFEDKKEEYDEKTAKKRENSTTK
jgi:hypothetical protein